MGSTFLRNITRTGLLLRQRNIAYGKNINSASTITPPSGYNPDTIFKKEMEELKTHYPVIAEELTAAISQYKEFPGLLERFPEMLDYTVPNDDPYFLTTALIPLYSYKAVENPLKLTDENIKKACIMAWVYRILEVSQILVDDMIDDSDVRYKKPVWFKKEGVGFKLSLLDSHYLVTGAYMILTKYLKEHPSCLNIVDLYMEKMFITFISQYMDFKNVGVKEFLRLINMRFDKALYVFDGSVRSGLYLANITDKETHELVKKFTIPISRFFQVQNDFSGVFVHEDKFQRMCPDIISGRNSWLVAMALKAASPAQRKIIEENYGNGNPESAEKVIEVYRDLKLDEIHHNTTVDFVKEMNQVIDSFPPTFSKEPFRYMVHHIALNKFYS